MEGAERFFHAGLSAAYEIPKAGDLPEEIRHYRKLNRLSTITDYIRENYTKELLSLEMVADRFGYSPSYLSRMFRKYAQTNYKTYLQNVRIEYGFQELANTDHTIGEIALNNGFPNQKALQGNLKRNTNSAK